MIAVNTLESSHIELWTHDAAFRYVRQFLMSQGGFVSPIIPAQHDYHCILNTSTVKYYCLFKKAKRSTDDYGNIVLRPQWFWKFPEFFKEFLSIVPDLNGAGESLNVDCLERALENNFTLLYVYGDGSIYIIDPKKIWGLHTLALTIYHGRGLIRSQDKLNEYKVAFGNGSRENINEATISFPVKCLLRIK